ncbi:hypothetical protein E0H75_03665 [Kribbella capetownensis]|uniref:Uncharacterized protein n=1 Tax=Kribbella capetownensis TaxID=1572659 RepID=A0A4R0K4N1_9ACTN|nr:hypothetical protein [Kribbella capetownensis]TCC52856.1 hypothetical protein E0H75_03665 [Kribbella capetownensis]
MSQQDQQHPAGGPQYTNQPNQAPPGGYPPAVQGAPPGWQQTTAPRKKTHKFRNFVVFPVGGLIALIVVISAASGGGAGDNNTASTGSDTATSAPAPKASAKPSSKAATTTQAPKTQAPATTECEGSRNDPCEISLGKAFTTGKHEMAAGWKLAPQSYGGYKLVGNLKNTSDGPSMAFFTVKFLMGPSVLASFQCSSTGDLEVGQSEDIECINMSDTEKTLKPGKYDKITAQADF